MRGDPATRTMAMMAGLLPATLAQPDDAGTRHEVLAKLAARVKRTLEGRDAKEVGLGALREVREGDDKKRRDPEPEAGVGLALIDDADAAAGKLLKPAFKIGRVAGPFSTSVVWPLPSPDGKAAVVLEASELEVFDLEKRRRLGRVGSNGNQHTNAAMTAKGLLLLGGHTAYEAR
ncbi:MAG: hypothetical protein K2W96_01325, partial [Gemmataceae bacterium]|nr:hypothetical protein [Gemmataceae bacterium]